MPGRLLVAYSNSSNYVSTTAEYLESLTKYCNMEVRYAHVTNGAKLDFDLNEFDAVFQSYCVRLPVDNYVSSDYLEKLKVFRGIKMLAAQDEYEDTNKLKSAMNEVGYHVFFTNAAGGMIEKLYPRAEFSNTEFVTVLTGYVPEQFEIRDRNIVPLRDRPIHVGYRCRRLPAYFGRLGFDKFEIGRRMREICLDLSIPCDIEWTDDKRLYGDAWYSFIGSCRANLGSETGSNVFDFDGKLRAKYEKMSKARGEPVPFEEFRIYTDPIEAKYDIGQISPRIFEAAAMHTPLILFSGKYLGIIAPDEHYIELKTDFSNIDEVLDRLDDVDALERMADLAYDRLVGSGEFSYRRFARLVEETMRRNAAERGVALRPPTGQFGPAEFGVQLAGLAEYRERPTVAPRHPAFHLYQNVLHQSQHYLREIDRLNEFYQERIVHLNEHIAQQGEALSNEIARLNQYYPERINYLNNYIIEENTNFTKEIQHLNEYYPEQIARLSTHISELNDNFNNETARLTEFYSTRIDQLNAVIARSEERWGGAGHPHRKLGAAFQKLISNSVVRRLGRTLMAYLPDQVGRRIKSRVVLLLHR
jgi:hypothetical protein